MPLAMCSQARRSAAHQAWALLLELWLQNKSHFADCAARHGLSVMQAHLLEQLEPDEPLRMNVLATELSCDASHVTGIVDKLERAGYVERRSLSGDRRVKIIALTGSGRLVREHLLDEVLEPPEALSRLSARQQRQLRDLLLPLLGAGLGRP